jgi:hypothetical protein
MIGIFLNAVLKDGKDEAAHEARNVGRTSCGNEKVSSMQAIIRTGRLFQRFDRIVERKAFSSVLCF